MALSYALGRTRTSSSGNPITFSYTVAAGDGAIIVLINGVGATNRAGGSLTLTGGPQPYTLTQRNSTQKAAASPEASCELWDVLNPIPGTYTVTIPNTGAISTFTTVVIARPRLGGRVFFIGANGGNGTSTNPTPGAVTVTEAGGMGVAIIAGGAQTWAPSAQVGTVIANTDDGATGGGEQYILGPAVGAHTLSWTFGTSDDWGAVASYYGEIPPHGLNNYQRMRAVSAGVISVVSQG